MWRALFRRKRWEQDLDEELRFHVEQRAADLVERGLLVPDAERQARMELGMRETYREECRREHGLQWIDEVAQDLRYALRWFAANRGFTLVAVLSLALGIGANTVVFSVLNTLLLKPLPVPEPNRIVFLESKRSGQTSYPNYRALRDRNTTFSGIAAYRIAAMGLDRGSGAERVWGYLVSGNYFETLGVKPALGRFFGPQEDRKPGDEPYAVISYSAWKNRFGGDPGVVGRTVRIQTHSFAIVGVAPAEFHGTEVFYWPDVYVPMMMQPKIEGWSWLNEPSTQNTLVTGRLRSGVDRMQAEANLNAIAQQLQKEYPKENDKLSFRVAPPGLLGGKGRGPVSAFVAGVMVLAGLVLLGACANLAALMTAKITDRYRELSIRLSLGAGRGRIVRQLLTESLMLSLGGGLAGMAMAVLLLGKLTAFRLPADLPIHFDVTPDYAVFGFTLAVCLMATLVFGILPARHAWRMDPNHGLKGGAGSVRKTRAFTTRDLLLGGQVAICCLLVTGCFVAVQGLRKTFSIPLGFDVVPVKVAYVDLSMAGFDKKRGTDFQRRALENLAAIPGVASAAYADTIPLSVGQNSTSVFRQDETEFRDSHSIGASVFRVSPGYFRTMGTRLIAGREFTSLDDADHPEVVVVNETLAKKVMGSTDAVGKRLRMYNKGAVEIVGVVQDGKYEHLTEEPRPALFRSITRSYEAEMLFVLRSNLPDEQIVPLLRQRLREVDPSAPILMAGSIVQMFGFAVFPAQAATVALSVFGVLAMMLAITGIYGLAAYSVSRRAKEIGIRVAVGARPRQVLGAVLGRTAVVVCSGAVAGIAGALACGKLMAAIVYQASPADPFVLGASVVTISALALVSAFGPARRAIGLDASSVLRGD